MNNTTNTTSTHEVTVTVERAALQAALKALDAQYTAILREPNEFLREVRISTVAPGIREAHAAIERALEAGN